MSKLYTAEGWINWDYLIQQNKGICMVVGPRGTGKTYGLLKYISDHNIKFIYLRRLKSQLQGCVSLSANPFKAVNQATGRNIIPVESKTGCLFYDLPEGLPKSAADPIGYGLALSTFATVRGADFSDVQMIVFDEAVAMTNERPIKDEFNAFLNFYETVNRNRELSGSDPVRCFLLGNANKLANPYFIGWGFMKQALKMIRGSQMVWRSPDRSRSMVLLLNSPISEKKRETILYKNGSEDFLAVALDNAFAVDPSHNVRHYPLKEMRHICSVGQIGIYKHKHNYEIVVTDLVDRTNYYDGCGIRLKQWQADYRLFPTMYLQNRIYFESYEVELLFRQYLNFRNS